jgi:hypothetical protein
MPTTVEFYTTEHERQIARDLDRLRGRLLGLIDVANLDYDQAKPMKELVKTLTYTSQAELIRTVNAALGSEGSK